jgi:hypothetical protein
MKTLMRSLRIVFSDALFSLLGISLTLNLLLAYYLIFLQTTTLEVFFASNKAIYNWSSIILTVLNAVLFGIALAMAAYVLRKRSRPALGETGNGFFAAAFGAISTGCPVCGAWLLPLLGIAGSLAAFPLQGLEIKLLSIFLLFYSIYESSKSIAGSCPVPAEKLLAWGERDLTLTLNRKTVSQLKPAVVIAASLILVYLLPQLPPKYKVSFASRNRSLAAATTITTASNQSNGAAVDTQALFAQVNPAKGYTIRARYGDLGPKLIAAGAIDLEKLKSVYERSGSPLTSEQLAILTRGSDKRITITQDNAYFLINFFWALGLANKNPILDQGPITKYGKSRIGSFASTGGWTVGAKKVTDIYSQSRLISLTPDQQAKVDEVAGNSYRPCCGNPTAFPDCNHGMALLAVLELEAANNASVKEMYEAAKYFNAFWFPQQYLDIASYFKAKQGLDFADVDPKTVVSRDFSSGQGWSKTKKWLASNNLVEKAPSGGGGCGV